MKQHRRISDYTRNRLFTNVEAVISLQQTTTTYRNTGLTPNRKYWYGRTVYLNSWTNKRTDGSRIITLRLNAGVLIEDYTDVKGGSAVNSVVEPPAEIIEAPAAGRIYPNPFSNGFNIDLYNSSATNKITTEILDVAGRLIERHDFSNVGPGNNTLRINETAAMKPGVYIVMVKVNGETVQTSRLAKTKE
jgi:hypothetical protein